MEPVQTNGEINFSIQMEESFFMTRNGLHGILTQSQAERFMRFVSTFVKDNLSMYSTYD